MGLQLEVGKCYKTYFMGMDEYFLCTEVLEDTCDGISLFVSTKQTIHPFHLNTSKIRRWYENDVDVEFPVEEFTKMVNEFLAKAKESIDKF